MRIAILSVFSSIFFLVADTRLYTLPCRSVDRSVRRSRNLFKLRAVFCITAPAKPSATVLPCIRPCFHYIRKPSHWNGTMFCDARNSVHVHAMTIKRQEKLFKARTRSSAVELSVSIIACLKLRARNSRLVCRSLGRPTKSKFELFRVLQGTLG